VRDVHRLTALARKRDPGLPLVLLGHSLGSIIAQQLIETRAADYDAVVLSGTAYRTLPHMNSGDLNARHAKQGPTTAEWLSRDRAVVDAFVADPSRLPDAHRERAERLGPRAIADYIAGMTDRFALRELERLGLPGASQPWPWAGA
jgi:alpha-beta hydrolase superfamily lysophospholipase